MKRTEFLRTAILAAIATPLLLPEILKEQPYTHANCSFRKSIGYPYDKDFLYFKVSDELIKDKHGLNAQLKHININRKIKSIKVGYQGNDFAKNMYSVKVMFV